MPVSGNGFERSQAVLHAACGREFTGAVARVERHGRVLFERAYGRTRTDACSRPVYLDTRFDLASLTKVFVATLALQLVHSGRMHLDDPLAAILTEWHAGAHDAITLRMLLSHSSGMQPGADYRTILDDDVERFTLTRELAARPGERVIYSDLGFIALGIAIARSFGRGLAATVREAFACPTLEYVPRAGVRGAIPATEVDDWRGRVQGTVHDEKAHLMGGTAGHAGLFGSAADVAALTEAYLGALHGRPSSLVSAGLARDAIAQQAYDPLLRRGLGWALKTRDDNSCGRWFDAASFGHTGFVGTCVWADPQRDLQAVLLTNAVYFGRSDTRAFRASFSEAVIEDVEPKPRA